MALTDAELKEWQETLKRNIEGMEGSSMFLSLFTEGYRKDPLAVMQFGLAVIMDKPIFVVAPEGVEIPENLKLLARRVEKCDFKDQDSVNKVVGDICKQATGIEENFTPYEGGQKLKETKE